MSGHILSLQGQSILGTGGMVETPKLGGISNVLRINYWEHIPQLELEVEWTTTGGRTYTSHSCLFKGWEEIDRLLGSLKEITKHE